MKLLNIFEIILIILLPLVLPLVWWVIIPDAQMSTIFMTVLVLQIIIAFSLYLIKQKSGNIVSAERALYQNSSDEQFISMYERSPIPYVTINQTGEIVMFNPSAIKLFETTANSIVGLNVFDMVVVENENNFSVIRGKIDSGITISDEELKIYSIAGNIKWVSFSVYAYEVKGQRLVSMVDITQEKIVDAAKSEFVALATHQLRTPISAIRWNVELLQKKMKGTITEEQTRYINKIERNIIRMIALINDFLSVSKLEMGTFSTSLQQINLTQFFDSIVDEYSEKIAEKNLKLNRTDTPVDLSFHCDSRLLHIIVSNLMSNSVKYVSSNGEIVLSYALVDNVVIIKVADNGIGIPINEVEKLFTKFYRASNAQSHKAEGTGLGLYIVKQSVEKLGGTIEVVSDQDAGAAFTVRLPYQTQ